MDVVGAAARDRWVPSPAASLSTGSSSSSTSKQVEVVIEEQQVDFEVQRGRDLAEHVLLQRPRTWCSQSTDLASRSTAARSSWRRPQPGGPP